MTYDAEPLSARPATIGTRGKRRARGSRRFPGCPKELARVDDEPTRIGLAARPTSRWTAHTDGPSGYCLRVTTRSHYRYAKPLSAHVSYDPEPLSARQAIIGARARQREPLLAYAPNTTKPLSAHTVRIGARDPRAMPLSARQAIIGPRDARREASSTPKSLSALGQSTRHHYRHGSHYRHPYPNDAKPRPPRDATIGTRGKRRARGSRRFPGCPKNSPA